MADLQFDSFESNFAASTADGRLLRAQRLVNLCGAVCSVALVFGLGFWGYQLAVRDVAGVPVMRAMAGPMRLAPADPGGNQASNQGLSVNAVAATGTSAPLAEQITLAPRVVALQPGDLIAPPAPAATTNAATPITFGISGQASSGGETPASVAGLAPLDGGASAIVDGNTSASLDLVDATAMSALITSLRPHARPQALTATGMQGLSQVETVAASDPASEVDPSTLAIGTRLAQFGAFDTPELARERFAQLQALFPDMLEGKAMVIQAAQSGGRSFYRLRAHGFDDDDAARRFCATLQAQETDCIPVAQR